MNEITELEKKRLNDHAEELINEFHEYVEGYKKEFGQDLDERLIFEGWAIQKIANTEVILLDLSERIDKLNESFRLLHNLLRK